MTLTLEIQNKNKIKNKTDFNRLVNRLGKQLAPSQYPEYKKCVRKNCLSEYKEYEEQLPTQLEKIAKCMFTENREKCFDQYYVPIINPLINCSKNKCSEEMHKLVNKLKQKQNQKSKFKTQKISTTYRHTEIKAKQIKEIKEIKENKQIRTNKKHKYYSESKAENPQETESKQDLSSSEISPEISYKDTQKIKKNPQNQKNIKYKKGDRLKAIFGEQNNHTSTVSLGRLDSQISESTIGMHVESSKN